MRGAMLAKLKSGLLNSKAGGSSPLPHGKETRTSPSGGGSVTAADEGDSDEHFDEPLDPNYMLQTQEKKQQQLARSVSNNMERIPHRSSPGRSPVPVRRGGSPRNKATTTSHGSLEVSALSGGCSGESSLDSPNMSRSRTLPGGSSPSTSKFPTSPSMGSISGGNSRSDVRDNSVAPGGSSVTVAFKKKAKEIRTLPASAPTEPSIVVVRGAAPNDDYVDPFDAKLRGALLGAQAATSGSPSAGGNGAGHRRHEPSDTYEDPFDTKHNGAYLSSGGRNSRRSSPPAADNDVYDSPIDARSSPLPPTQSDDGNNYMDPFDQKPRPRSSPLPQKKTSKVRLVDNGKLPPSSSSDGNYCEPFDAIRTNGGVYPPATAAAIPPRKHSSTASTTSRLSTGSIGELRTGPPRTISVPEVLIDSTRNDDEPVSSRGGQRHGGMSPMREPSSDYCEPLDSVLRHARASQNSSGGRSPVHPRSPSSERAPSERSPENSLPGSTNISRSNSSRSLRNDGEVPPEKLPLDDQPWYHGALRRDDAERRLAGAAAGYFIIRQSESCLTDFSLSLRNHHETMHLKIHRRSKDNRFVLGLHSMPFRSIPEMITYYLKHNLPIRGAEHISLVQGLPRNSPIYANVHLVDGSS
eukprot:scpid71775/ scgid24124/ SH2 domain-containing adapter protein F